MPAEGWPYMLMNLKLPSTHVILRKLLEEVVKGGKRRWKDTLGSKTYNHPFTDFPIIYSHVHPCYVTLNAWDKLQNVRKFPNHWLPEQKKCARLVVKIAELCFSQDPSKDFAPNPKITISMRRLRVTQQARAVRDAENEEADVEDEDAEGSEDEDAEGSEDDYESSTPPPELVTLDAPLIFRAETGEERPDSESSSGSEQSTPSRKRPVAGPSRQPANASRKRPRRGPGPSRG